MKSTFSHCSTINRNEINFVTHKTHPTTTNNNMAIGSKNCRGISIRLLGYWVIRGVKIIRDISVFRVVRLSRLQRLVGL